MNPLFLLLLSLQGITVVSSIFINPNGVSGDYGGGGRSFSSSSSSEEHGGRRHRHRHRRPPRPRPPRPQSSEEPPEPKRCPVDWMTFDRTDGPWCVKVFYGPATQAVAEQLCQAQQATLSGVQNANERMQVADAARVVVNQNGGGQMDVWLGAKRRAQCPNKPSCAPLNTFEWTDGSTTGTDGFWWPANEPNAIWFNNWGQQNCLVQLVSGNSAVARFGYPHGSMDDQHCQNNFRAYTCGKRA